jgi:hypothetical protein
MNIQELQLQGLVISKAPEVECASYIPLGLYLVLGMLVKLPIPNTNTRYPPKKKKQKKTACQLNAECRSTIKKCWQSYGLLEQNWKDCNAYGKTASVSIYIYGSPSLGILHVYKEAECPANTLGGFLAPILFHHTIPYRETESSSRC